MDLARRTLAELAARMRAEGRDELAVPDTDPPLVLVTAERWAEVGEDLEDQGVMLDRLAGDVDLSEARPVDELMPELEEEERRIREGLGCGEEP